MQNNATTYQRLEQLNNTISVKYKILMIISILTITILLLFVQDPMVHNALHNFRHGAGITCH